jgi:hypothetical protein
MKPSQYKGFITFVNERHNIYERRMAKMPKPWTKDKILQTYRFCNVEREHDRVTRWLADNWREPNRNDPDLWFAMVVARNINAPDTLAQLGYPVPWKPARFLKMTEARKAQGLTIYNPAYIIVPSATSMPKDEYLANRMFSPMWKDRAKLRPTKKDTLEAFYERLSQYQGMGPFMSAQVIADLKYAPPLQRAADWWTFAKPGPGSKRGMNRLLGRDVRGGISEAVWYAALLELQAAMKGKLTPNLHAQDLQNCLCEYDKYERVRLGEGVPKQKYNGAAR